MNDVSDNSNPIPDVCPECQVGALQPGRVIFYAMMDGRLLSIPDFPAWVCDICRHCEYDEDALADLRTILGPSAKLPAEPARRRRTPPEDATAWNWSRTSKKQ
jgi:YgiT-type zinc finger domain-containing protein